MQAKNLLPGSALALLLLPCLLAGCYVKVDKSKDGEDKNVEVHLPMGAIHVQQSPPSAGDMELPNYPGAVALEDNHGKSADIHLGFGNWQMHLRVAKYQTGDPQARVTTFYRTALGHFGDVLECRGGQAIGPTSVTREGLGCNDKHGHSKGININDDDNDEDGYTLRAGSKRHQHIVRIKAGSGSGTRFTLLRLDLPADGEDTDRQE